MTAGTTADASRADASSNGERDGVQSAGRASRTGTVVPHPAANPGGISARIRTARGGALAGMTATLPVAATSPAEPAMAGSAGAGQVTASVGRTTGDERTGRSAPDSRTTDPAVETCLRSAGITTRSAADGGTRIPMTGGGRVRTDEVRTGAGRTGDPAPLGPTETVPLKLGRTRSGRTRSGRTRIGRSTSDPLTAAARSMAEKTTADRGAADRGMARRVDRTGSALAAGLVSTATTAPGIVAGRIGTTAGAARGHGASNVPGGAAVIMMTASPASTLVRGRHERPGLGNANPSSPRVWRSISFTVACATS